MFQKFTQKGTPTFTSPTFTSIHNIFACLLNRVFKSYLLMKFNLEVLVRIYRIYRLYTEVSNREKNSLSIQIAGHNELTRYPIYFLINSAKMAFNLLLFNI